MTADGYPVIGLPSGWRRPAPQPGWPASPRTRCATPPGIFGLASGASVVTVQKLLGHLSPMTTCTIYAHQLPDDFDNLATALDFAARRAATVY